MGVRFICKGDIKKKLEELAKNRVGEFVDGVFECIDIIDHMPTYNIPVEGDICKHLAKINHTICSNCVPRWCEYGGEKQ